MFLKVDSNRFNRMRDDSHNLFFMDSQHIAGNPFSSTLQVGGDPLSSTVPNINYASPTSYSTYNRPGIFARLGNMCCGDTRDVPNGKAWGNTQGSLANSPANR